MTGLRASVVVRRGGFSLDAVVEVDDGEVLAVVGPNGAGKSTLLRAIAGLEPGATVEIGGQDVSAAAPWQRGIGLVFPDQRLFDHLDVAGNIAFGPSVALGRATARATAKGLLTEHGLAHLAHRRPAQLSSGEAQRVALLRALAVRPAALLLDEPLSAVDAASRPEARRLLASAVAGFPGPTVLVTHDPLDALVLAGRVMVLEAGRVVQDAPAGDLARHPRTAYVATLLGQNFWRGKATSGEIRLDEGGVLHTPQFAEAGAVCVVAAPESVTLMPAPASVSARNQWPATVTAVERRTDRMRLTLQATTTDGPALAVADVTEESLSALGIAVGSACWASIKATALTVYVA